MHLAVPIQKTGLSNNLSIPSTINHDLIAFRVPSMFMPSQINVSHTRPMPYSKQTPSETLFLVKMSGTNLTERDDLSCPFPGRVEVGCTEMRSRTSTRFAFKDKLTTPKYHVPPLHLQYRDVPIARWAVLDLPLAQYPQRMI